MLPYLFILIGIVLLYFGGEFLVTHAAKLARLLGISPMVVGLTVVAFATSSPELAATIAASFKDTSDVALGNVIGSNIANIGLILGISAMIFPVSTRIKFIKREGIFMVISSMVVSFLCLNGELNRIEGLSFVLLITAYLVVVVRTSHDAPDKTITENVPLKVEGSLTWSVFMVVIGVLLLVAGAERMVEGSIEVARSFGIPEPVIGLSFVALGTSLPELASCIVAAMRKESDIILGNVIGSNIFNMLCVLGAAVLIRPLEFDTDGLLINVSIMLSFSVVILPFLFMGTRLSRKEGFVILAGYVIYMVYLFNTFDPTNALPPV